jgi:hypothetical protein
MQIAPFPVVVAPEPIAIPDVVLTTADLPTATDVPEFVHDAPLPIATEF